MAIGFEFLMAIGFGFLGGHRLSIFGRLWLSITRVLYLLILPALIVGFYIISRGTGLKCREHKKSECFCAISVFQTI